MVNSSRPGEGSSAEYGQLKAERDRALESAAKWRRFYEVEAQQRRLEAEVAEKTISDLRAELLQLCQIGGPVVRSATLQRGEGGISGRLRLEVAELQRERDRLAHELALEQQQHAKTRENLVTALGDVLQRRK